MYYFLLHAAYLDYWTRLPYPSVKSEFVGICFLIMKTQNLTFSHFLMTFEIFCYRTVCYNGRYIYISDIYVQAIFLKLNFALKAYFSFQLLTIFVRIRQLWYFSHKLLWLNAEIDERRPARYVKLRLASMSTRIC